MVLNDTLADAISKINNATKAGHKEVIIKQNKLIIALLEVLKKKNYVGTFEIVKDNKQGLIKINLIGMINKCKVIKPRYQIKIADIERFEKKFLPGKDFGILLISTNEGILTQFEAKEKNVGGALVAYCY